MCGPHTPLRLRLAMRNFLGWSLSQLSPAPARSRPRPAAAVERSGGYRRLEEVGVTVTKTFLGQLLAFYGLAITLAERRVGQQAGGATITRERMQPQVKWFFAVSEQLREHDRRSEELAHRFESTQNLIFLVSGSNYPIALESDLEFKEISYI